MSDQVFEERGEMHANEARPITMTAGAVRAILQGTKTQTRRLILPQPQLGQPWRDWDVDPEVMDLPFPYCPFGAVGDTLWVREAWAVIRIARTRSYGSRPGIAYRADGPLPPAYNGVRWKPARSMKRWASRTSLAITRVRVEQLRDLSETDALAEGVPQHESAPDATLVERFAESWDATHVSTGLLWKENPWVWVIEFNKVAN